MKTQDRITHKEHETPDEKSVLFRVDGKLYAWMSLTEWGWSLTFGNEVYIPVKGVDEARRIIANVIESGV